MEDGTEEATTALMLHLVCLSRDMCTTAMLACLRGSLSISLLRTRSHVVFIIVIIIDDTCFLALEFT